ncbi:MAG TPA: EamA family transporter [Solirubrobacteraceae bacterium]|nr:EamA family transporter [Solirubrobacteraceae bacterium]
MSSSALPLPAEGPSLKRVPAPALFVGGALSQYAGSALAVTLFAALGPARITLLRVLIAGVVLVVVRRPRVANWSWATVRDVLAFGAALACMNLVFYEAIARLPLGSAVAIEFAGPIVMAAVGSRTRRDLAALGFAVAGVALLADLQISGSPAGVGFALAAGAMWALYIRFGHRVANHPSLRPGDGLAVALLFGGVLLLVPLAAQMGPALRAPGLLAQAASVAIASSVVPYALEQVAMRRLPRARFALLLALLPATATLMGAVILGQIPGAPEGCGVGLVVLAAALRSHRADTAPPARGLPAA